MKYHFSRVLQEINSQTHGHKLGNRLRQEGLKLAHSGAVIDVTVDS
jgi:hypothetical protein